MRPRDPPCNPVHGDMRRSDRAQRAIERSHIMHRCHPAPPTLKWTCMKARSEVDHEAVEDLGEDLLKPGLPGRQQAPADANQAQ
eukprot:5300974-Prymnesium_polylepis.1